MKDSKVITIFLTLVVAIGVNFFLFSVCMELIREQSDISVFIGMLVFICLIIADYLTIKTLIKYTTK